MEEMYQCRGQIVSVKDYYYDELQMNLKYPSLPCICINIPRNFIPYSVLPRARSIFKRAHAHAKFFKRRTAELKMRCAALRLQNLSGAPLIFSA
jgi:hypothetical protein